MALKPAFFDAVHSSLFGGTLSQRQVNIFGAFAVILR